METRRRWLSRAGGLAALGAVAGNSRAAAQESRPFGTAKSEAWRAELNEVLRANILRFWLDKSIDREHGGYYMHFDEAGARKAENTKAIVTQARTLWLFSGQPQRFRWSGAACPRGSAGRGAARLPLSE